jgi:hypothetical protein
VHRIGRQIGIVSLTTGVGYLVWRCGWSWRGGGASIAWWLAVPALAIEISGFACVSILIWALWRRPSANQPGTTGPTNTQLEHGIVIIASGRTAQDLRSTLVAVRLDPSRPSALVIDHDGRSEIVHVAAEFGANYRVPDTTDTTGLAAAVAASEREFLLVLTAGDVPAIGAAQSLMSWVSDDSVAIVQGVVGATPGASSEDGSNAQHEFAFERTALNPGLGARGTGIVTGSGALVRRSALSDIDLCTGSRHSVLFELMPRLAAKNRRVVACAGTAVVAEKPLTAAAAVAANRRAIAAAGWQLVVGKYGALRSRGIRRHERLALAAWAVRSVDGLRRIALTATVLGALLAGRAPFRPTAAALWFLWAPAFVLASVALTLLSGGALRPGDRLRGSVRALSLSVGMVIAINAVLVIRGVSDRFTHALHQLDHTTQIGLTAVSLWLLAGSLDSLRLLAWRRQTRRAFRLAASGTAHLDDYGVYVSDITMLGAGLLADHTVLVRAGSRHRLSFSVPSESGITSLDIPCVVRNVRPDLAGAWRVGVEFYDADSWALNTLAESCAVVPARAALTGTLTNSNQFDDAPAPPLGQRRVALRIATLFALAGVVSSIAPIYAEAGGPSTREVIGTIVDDADPPVLSTTSSSTSSTPPAQPIDTTTNTIATDSSPRESALPIGSVVPDPTSAKAPPTFADVGQASQHTDLAGITVIAVCSTDPGPDARFGTSDDSYAPSLSTLTDEHGHYNLSLSGKACWLSIEPPMTATSPGAAQPSNTDDDNDPMLVDLGGSGTITMATTRINRLLIASNTVPPVANIDVQSASLGDRVWADLNADGVQQPHEAGVAHVTVTLYNALGRTLGSQITGADGSFSFDHLDDGRYSVGVSNLPRGLHMPRVNPLTSRTSFVSLKSGEQLSNFDIGVVRSSAPTARPAANTLLPTPMHTQLNPRGPSGIIAVQTLLILLGAMFLAGSVLFATAQPNGVRRGVRRPI